MGVCVGVVCFCGLFFARFLCRSVVCCCWLFVVLWFVLCSFSLLFCCLFVVVCCLFGCVSSFCCLLVVVVNLTYFIVAFSVGLSC